MSFRVHAIAKEVGMTSKELVALLVERGYEIKSASSSIDNITAESLVEELKPSEAEVVEVEESDVAEPEADDKPKESADEELSSDDSTVAVPIVKSKQDIDRERLEKQEAEDRAKEASSPAVSPDASDPGAVPLAPPPPAPVAPTPPKPSAIMAPPPPPTGKSAEPETSEDAPDAPDTATVAPSSSDSKILLIKPPIVVREFAVLIGLKPFQLISELMEMGIFASMNQSIEEDVAQQLASSKGFELDIRHRGEKAETTKQKEQQARKVDEDDESLLEPRSPVVCILGHVDHGKTTLLDTIRKANVVSGEAGGITQHVGAYQIEHNGQKITFLDTPGHAAFSKIRERGANLTDISVLVVAADDGFMPQTDEALKFAQRAQGSIVVAINKTDVKGADIDKVKTHMQERGIPSEDWGGETVTVSISALKGENIEDLLVGAIIVTTKETEEIIRSSVNVHGITVVKGNRRAKVSKIRCFVTKFVKEESTSIRIIKIIREPLDMSKFLKARQLVIRREVWRLEILIIIFLLTVVTLVVVLVLPIQKTVHERLSIPLVQ